jgi:hypothetical protein
LQLMGTAQRLCDRSGEAYGVKIEERVASTVC